MRAALGIDGCRRGWVGVLLPDTTTWFGERLRDLLDQVEVEAVGVDMPIDLADDGARAAEVEARRRVGGRRSSVFTAPARATLDAPDHATALALSRAATGKGLSVQAFALMPKIRDVAATLAAGTDVPVVEVHPEVSFATIAGRPLTFSKHSPEGLAEREGLLAAVGIAPHRLTAPPGSGATRDDVLDAAAAAWSATRFAEGTAERLPAEPRDQLAPAIWV